MVRFADEVRAYELQLLTEAADPDNLASGRDAEPPQQAVAVPVGAGKTHKTLEALVAFVTDASAPWERRAAVFAPTHTLAREIAGRIAALAPSVAVAVFAGQGQTDPNAPNETMCRKADFMSVARREGASIDDACRRCPLREHKGVPAGCGYRGQRAAAKSAQVVIFAGNAGLGDPVPKWLQRETPTIVAGWTVHRRQFDAVVIDEPVVGQLVHGLDRTELAATCIPLGTILAGDFLDPKGFPVSADEDAKIVDARAKCAPVLRALAAGGGRAISHADLASAGVGSEADARDMWRVAIGAKVEPKVWEETPTPEDAARRAHSAQALAVARIFGALASWFAKGHAHGPHEACAAIVRDDLTLPGGVKLPVLAARWTDPIHDAWTAPTLLLDATANDAALREWFPRLKTGRVPHGWPPAGTVHVRQVYDQALGYSRLDTLGAPFAEKIARHVEIEAAKRRGAGRDGIDALLIGPKKFVADVKRAWGGKPPAGIDAAHFGAVRGLDKWAGVAHLTVISRPLPPLEAMEELASIVGGRDVMRLRDWMRAPAVYAMADGTVRKIDDVVPQHADLLAEAFRKAACDDELLQAIGRARALRRTSPGELGIDVLTSHPVEGLLVDELVKLDDILAPADSLVLGLAARGVIVDPAARGPWTVVAGLMCGDVTQADTVRKAESRRAGSSDGVTLAAIEARRVWSACNLRFPDAPRYSVPCRVRGADLSEIEATIAEAAILGGLATPPSVEAAAGRAKHRRVLNRTNAYIEPVISVCPVERTPAEAAKAAASTASNDTEIEATSVAVSRIQTTGTHSAAAEPASDVGPASLSAITPADDAPLAPEAPPSPASIVVDRDRLAAFGQNLGLARPTVRRVLDTLRPIERRHGLDAAARCGIETLIGEALRRGAAHPDAVRAAVAGLTAAA